MELEEIKPFKNMIEQYAWIALKKIRKPTIYSHEDLVNEGIALLIEVKEKRYQPEKKASLKTYFTLLLRNYFGDIVTKSYSCHTCFPNEERAKNFVEHLRKKDTYRDIPDNVNSKILVEGLTFEETIYGSTMLFASGKSMNKRRQEAREILNLTVGQEDEIRRNILIKMHT